MSNTHSKKAISGSKYKAGPYDGRIFADSESSFLPERLRLRIRDGALPVCSDGADMNKFRTRALRSPRDVLRAVPLDVFEHFRRAMHYANERHHDIRIFEGCRQRGGVGDVAYDGWHQNASRYM